MNKARAVIVGAGFAGYHAARTLSTRLGDRAEVVLLNPTDYFLYLPLLPQVAAGILEPRRVTVSLTATLPRVRLVLGEANSVDLDARRVQYTHPEGGSHELEYDTLLLAVGSVNRLLPIPGVGEYAHGFRGLPEALYLRDHIVQQLELAAQATDDAERRARSTFVVVGAGYTGTEVAAHGQRFAQAIAARADGSRPRWLLLDIAPRVLPELDQRLSDTATRVLQRRGVELRMGTSVKEARPDGVLLDTGKEGAHGKGGEGEFIPTHSLIWCVGVRPDPLVDGTGLPTEQGRLVVDRFLNIPGHQEVFACGDAACVPDLTRPGHFTPMTAQHAWRQGRTAALNIAADHGSGHRRPYEHHDRGFAVDLGGFQAAANPLHVPLSGALAGAVTRGYHLAVLPANRIRVTADWLLDAMLPRQAVQLGMVRSGSIPLDSGSPELVHTPQKR